MNFIILFFVSLAGIVLLVAFRGVELHMKQISFHHVTSLQTEKERILRLLSKGRIIVSETFGAVMNVVLRVMRSVRRSLFAIERKLVAVKPTEEAFVEQGVKPQGNPSLFLRHMHSYKRMMQKGEIHE